MQQNVRPECPKCSRPLQRFNGHVGYCSQHKWVSPLGLGFDAEAAEQNRQDAAAEEERRRDAERAQAQQKEQRIRQRRQSNVRKAVAAVVALCLIAAAVGVFVIHPRSQYSRAAEQFAAGAYETARDEFTALGSYQDASMRAKLCDMLLNLQDDQLDDADEQLNQLLNADAAQQTADALLPVMAHWRESGLSPCALLMLLDKADAIDPAGTLDVAALRADGHAALLDGTQLSAYTEDINGDGEAELIVLNADFSVTVYRMTTDANVRLAVDNATAAACETAFAKRLQTEELDAAVACFAAAYRLLPSEETRADLTAAYRTRATQSESAGDGAAAAADAKRAVETSLSADDFTFFYDVSLRNCRAGSSAAEAIARWADFAADNAADLTRYAAKDRWQSDAAQLHMAYAAELASQRDAACVAELRTASELGADVTAAISEAESHFQPGATLAQLRLMEMALCGDEAKSAQIFDTMSGEIRHAISDWQTIGTAAADVPALIYLANQQGIDLTGCNPDAAYEQAALAAAGGITQSSFVDWNADGYKELLTLDAQGNLTLYGLENGAWAALAAADTRLAGAAYTITDDAAHLVLVLSNQQDELLALAGTELAVLFREKGISRYQISGTAVTFSRQLAGSIARYADYRYDAMGIANRPVRTGVDWQQQDYPQPESAKAAVQRYFEARAYDIAAEAQVLTASGASALFDAQTLAALAVPDVPGTVDAAAYQQTEDTALLEVTYPSGGQNIRAWVAAEYHDGWKVTGASDTYGENQDASKVDYSVALLCLNEEISVTLAAKGQRSTYRVMIPSSGRLTLVWQSGTKAQSRAAYTVAMHQGSLTGAEVFSYDLQPSPNKQQSKDFFVAPGVYYITVEAKTADPAEYHLTIPFAAEENVELEGNDTAANATPIALNTAYAGMLASAQDVDFFAFTLAEDSAVNAALTIPGSGGKSAAYTCTVFRAADGSRLCAISVPGNVQRTETGNLYLPAGTYWVQVAKGSTYTNDAYHLTVSAFQNGAMEAEPNNTPETANAAPLNEDIHASFGQAGDIDCYRFTLDADAVVQPQLAFQPTDSSSRTYVLTLMDASRRELLKVNIGGKESSKVIAPIALPAGTYTVKVENPRFVQQDYTLHLTSMTVDTAEREPNDTAALATTLPLDTACTGVLTTQEDVDYYKLTFAEQTTVTLTFAFAQGTSKNTAFVLTIEQNGKTQWTANIKGDSGGMKQELQFPAGEYYIRVKPSTWMSAVYTITVAQ